jgi:hypothetical protein
MLIFFVCGYYNTLKNITNKIDQILISLNISKIEHLCTFSLLFFPLFLFSSLRQGHYVELRPASNL